MAVLLLLNLQHSAHADLWAHVDERGVTHFATEPLDSRYQLFFKGDQFDSKEARPPGVLGGGTAAAALPASSQRLLAYFDIAPGYKRVKHHLRAASARHGVDYELLQALIAAESGFDATAVSPRGAVGLMQVMPATAERFGVVGDAQRPIGTKLADPAINVPVGTRYLRYLIDLFPARLDLALAAYNAGEGAVQRAGLQIPPYKETQKYVQTVLALYTQLKPPAPVQAQRQAGGRVRMQWPGAVQASGPVAPAQIAQSPSLTEPVPNE